MAKFMKFVKKLWKAFKNMFENIGMKMMNLTAREEIILKKMLKEQEQKKKFSVSVIIAMDGNELEDREKLMAKFKKDQELIKRLDEVKYDQFMNMIKLAFQDDFSGYCLLLWFILWPILYF